MRGGEGNFRAAGIFLKAIAWIFFRVNWRATMYECRWMFTESKADETVHVTYTNVYSMAGRRDIDRTCKCVSEWRFFLVKTCIYFVLFLTTLWMCYRTIKGMLGSCQSLCLLLSMLFNFWKKVKFLIFFYWVVSFVVGSLWDRCGSLWVVVDRCGSLWVVVGRSGF